MIADVQSLQPTAHTTAPTSLCSSPFSLVFKAYCSLQTNKSLLPIVVALQVWIQIRSKNSETQKHLTWSPLGIG